jgi:hypothetical protein
MVLVILSYPYLVPDAIVHQKRPLIAQKIGFSIVSQAYLWQLFSTVVLQVRGIARISSDAAERDPLRRSAETLKAKNAHQSTSAMKITYILHFFL